MHDTGPVYRPWGVVSPDFWESAAPVPDPSRLDEEALRARFAQVADVATSGDLPEAIILAHRLDEDVTTVHGEVHLHTVNVREIRGYLAHLAAEHRQALGWYLHAVRLRATVQGTAHPDTQKAGQRAYSLWVSIPISQEWYQLGNELLATLTDIHGPASPLVQHTRERLTPRVLEAGSPHRSVVGE
ncbi:hypothetical protein [Streptomyces sp. NPDC006784]|uniref:hypothetical protein n=1 Tax=Streptomyces sp. NPDC006784 TaxID=3364764 RepID=UPI0036CE6DD1